MNKAKIYSILLSTIKEDARLYKYYIKNIIFSLMNLNKVTCSSWISPLDKPSEEKGIFYKCNHVFFNSENRKELIKCSCIVKPNEDVLHLVIKNLVNKTKQSFEIDALNDNNKFYEQIKLDYYKDKNSIKYTNNLIVRDKFSSDDEIIKFTKSITDFNFKGCEKQ